VSTTVAGIHRVCLRCSILQSSVAEKAQVLVLQMDRYLVLTKREWLSGDFWSVVSAAINMLILLKTTSGKRQQQQQTSIAFLR